MHKPISCMNCGGSPEAHDSSCVEPLCKRIVELEAEVAELDDDCKRAAAVNQDHEKRIAQLLAALQKYGQHDSQCAIMWDDDELDPSECSCGLAEATRLPAPADPASTEHR